MSVKFPHDYDRISRFYDRLGRLVFWGALMRSQSHFLSVIPTGSRVLLVGGGTGEIVERLAHIRPKGLHIVYVELSHKMLQMARKRAAGGNTVQFVHADITEYTDATGFDVAITPFLFDNFLPGHAHSIHSKISGMLRPGGYWLYTDFVPRATGWKKLLLKGMYLFFGALARVQARQIPEMAVCFAAQYHTVHSKTFYSGFMEAVVYQKMA